MDEYKNDSVFVLKLIMIIAGFFMVFFSKLGYYLLLLTITVIFYIILHYGFNIPFWKHFMNSILISTVLFEICFPRLANFTKSTYLEVKVEYDKAKAELQRRRSGIENEL